MRLAFASRSSQYGLFCTAYLSELWNSGAAETCKLGMASARGLLQSNPRMGLEVFTSRHFDEATADPTQHVISPLEVVAFLKTVVVSSPEKEADVEAGIPLHNGSALAASFLSSALGLNRAGQAGSTLSDAAREDPDVVALHDQLCFLLLEGLIGSTGGDGSVSPLGLTYRTALHKFLSWPHALYNASDMREFFPATFKHEHALLLGKMGMHKEALSILYKDLRDVDLAIGYCDNLWEARREREESAAASAAAPYHEGGGMGGYRDGLEQDVGEGVLSFDDDGEGFDGMYGEGGDRLSFIDDDVEGGGEGTCPYLPLIEVALEAEGGDPAKAVNIMAMRRDYIDQAAALRALPDDTPMSLLTGDVLIPAFRSAESR